MRKIQYTRKGCGSYERPEAYEIYLGEGNPLLAGSVTGTPEDQSNYASGVVSDDGGTVPGGTFPSAGDDEEESGFAD